MPAGEIHLLAGFEKILAGFSPCYSSLQHSLNSEKKGRESSDTVMYFNTVGTISHCVTCVSRMLTGDFGGTSGLCRFGIFGSCSETVWQGELFTYHRCLIKRLDKPRHDVPFERNYLGIHFRCSRRSGSARSPPVMKRPWRLSGQVLW